MLRRNNMGNAARMLLAMIAIVSACAYPVRAQAPAGAKPPVDKTAQKLKQRILDAARKTYELEVRRLQNAQVGNGVDRLARWSQRWLDAQLDLAGGKKDRVEAYEQHVERMRSIERTAAALANAGVGTEGEASAAEYFRLRAELLLEQARVK